MYEFCINSVFSKIITFCICPHSSENECFWEYKNNLKGGFVENVVDTPIR